MRAVVAGQSGGRGTGLTHGQTPDKRLVLCTRVDLVGSEREGASAGTSRHAARPAGRGRGRVSLSTRPMLPAAAAASGRDWRTLIEADDLRIGFEPVPRQAMEILGVGDRVGSIACGQRA